MSAFAKLVKAAMLRKVLSLKRSSCPCQQQGRNHQVIASGMGRQQGATAHTILARLSLFLEASSLLIPQGESPGRRHLPSMLCLSQSARVQTVHSACGNPYDDLLPPPPLLRSDDGSAAGGGPRTCQDEETDQDGSRCFFRYGWCG